MRNKILFSLMVGLLLLGSCDPNKELYVALDSLQEPYQKAITYTLTSPDYNLIEGSVRTNQAFSDSMVPKDHVPRILTLRFLGLNLKSSAVVNFNYLVGEPRWMKAGFGYVLTQADYEYMNVFTQNFSPTNPPEVNLTGFLLKTNLDAPIGKEMKIIYNYWEDGVTTQSLDRYKFDGNDWILQETIEKLPFVGYELIAADYEAIGGTIATSKNFSDAYPANVYVPVWLKNKFPYAISGAQQVVKYKSSAIDQIAHYVFDGQAWIRSSNTEVRSEQYIYGSNGWAFDPTVRFIMPKSDYMYLATIDPIPHAVYIDFGYYYGSSAMYNNFDLRLLARRTQKNAEGNYHDPALGAIFDNEGKDKAEEEMFRRIVEEGLIKMLQNKYPGAVPQSGGIDVHYVVGFETYNDNFSRSYLEAEYRCVSAGSPPVFELIDGPRNRE